MTRIFKLTLMSLAAAFLAGCANLGADLTKTQDNTYKFCSIAGGVAGGAAAGAAVSGPAALGGAASGAMLALLLCDQGEAAPAAEPVVAECADVPPPGALLDLNGCAFDTDGDGVVDGVDMCANTPEGVEVDRVGCPLDEDRDGTPDYKDQCLGTPLGTIVDQDGCPLAGETVLSLTGVNFAVNKAILTADAKFILDEAVAAIKAMNGVDQIRVEGHTDSTASESYNLALSQRRAEAVVAYLVDQGIDSSRLLPVGMGEGYPVANNDTAAGRAANRRVDFVIN
jgi:OOP family OmpA-OmpF porin